MKQKFKKSKKMIWKINDKKSKKRSAINSHHECQKRRVGLPDVIVHGPAYLDTCPSLAAAAAEAHLYLY